MHQYRNKDKNHKCNKFLVLFKDSMGILGEVSLGEERITSFVFVLLFLFLFSESRASRKSRSTITSIFI